MSKYFSDVAEHFSGALKSEITDDVPIYDNIAGGSGLLPVIPCNYSLIEYSFTPRNQGNRSTCAAFVGATISEILNNIKSKYLDQQMSPEYIYANRANISTHGMTGRDVCRILSDNGSLPEIYMPYDPAESARTVSKSMKKIAKKYRLGLPMLVLSIDALKRAVYELGPCYLMLPLQSQDEMFWRKPAKVKRKSVNGIGHAVTVIGYNSDGFIFINSWGVKWGENGYGLLPYNDWKYVVECWTILPGIIEKEKKDCCGVF